MSYSLFLEKQVIKFLSKLENETKLRIFNKLKKLEIQPVPHDAKRLVNVKEKVFRIRIGNYRALYI
ncbi:MAG: type II toxin-antitoxin system RelE family toxin [Nanoarchaeota archaeon]